jgi:hypothetical protein
MSVLKTVGIFGAIGGVGLIGYYLFNKYKPTIANIQSEELKGQQYVLKEDKNEHRKLWSIVAQYGYDNLGKNQSYLDLKKQLLTQNPLIISNDDYLNLSRFYDDMNTKGVSERILGKDLYNLDNSKYSWEKKFQGIGDEIFGFNKFGSSILGGNCEYNPNKEENPCAYNYKPIETFLPLKGNTNYDIVATNNNFNSYWKYAPKESMAYFWNIPQPTGKDIKISASNCVELDRDIKKLIDRIAEQTRTTPDEKLRIVLTWYKSILQDNFELFGCSDKVEKQRLLDIAKITTLGAISAESSVLGKNQKDQNIYLGVGALVLVLSAGILASSGSSSTASSSSSSIQSSSGGILANVVILGGLAGMGYLIFKKPKVVLPNT